MKIKKLICFCVIKNEANAQVLEDIIRKFVNFENDKAELIFDDKNIMKETTKEK